MRSIPLDLAAVCAAMMLVSALPARADDAVDLQKVLTSHGCTGCHAKDRKIVGPALHDVAAKYASDPQAAVKIAANIRGGGVGRWGQVPMPPMPTLTDTELAALAAYVLKQ